MIVKAFSEYLIKSDDSISSVRVLEKWLNGVLTKKPGNKVEEIVHKEIELKSDDNLNLYFSGKSKSWRKLVESLYNYANSYEQQKFTRWVHNIKASDFKDYDTM